MVVNTRAGLRYGHADYVSSGCGMGRAATLYLLERGVRLTGTDGWSWDAPFIHTKDAYAATADPALIWEGHKAGRDIGYCHLEKLHNLEALPDVGFMVSCFPVKIRGASAGEIIGGDIAMPQLGPRAEPAGQAIGRNVGRTAEDEIGAAAIRCSSRATSRQAASQVRFSFETQHSKSQD